VGLAVTKEIRPDNEHLLSVGVLLGEVGSKLRYLCGPRSRPHLIAVEKVSPTELGVTLPRCLDGRGSAPQDASGLRLLDDEEFSPADVNAALARFD
jgi:hypothetical protein